MQIKTTITYRLTPTRMASINKKTGRAASAVEKWNLTTSLLGVRNGVEIVATA